MRFYIAIFIKFSLINSLSAGALGVKTDELKVLKDVWFEFHKRGLRKYNQWPLVFHPSTLMPLNNADLLKRCGAAVLKDTTMLRGYRIKRVLCVQVHWKGVSPPPSLYLCMYMYVCKICKCLNLWLPLQAGTAAGLTPSCPHYKEICEQLLSVVLGLLFLSWLLFSNLLNRSVFV